ncbi:MAG: hypothetical protein MAG453_01821 [Calditrichaeota bacterium]|nr:hypothetical protein [Calditrichota bacterium]
MAAIPRDQRDAVARAKQWASASSRAWILPWLLVGVVAAAGAVEWIASPVENALGSFMLWSQPVRPEAGRGWELNREGAEALQELSELAERTRRRRAAGTTLSDWDEIPAMLDSFQVFSVSPERFLDLYGRLPEAMRERVLDPVQVLRARTGGRWRRVFFVNDMGSYRVYLISAENIVLYQSTLARELFDRLEQLHTPIAGRLRDLDRYPIVISAETFFSSLTPEGPVRLDGVDVSWISDLEGELTHVGMAERPADGIWELGFEVVRGGAYSVHIYWVKEETGRTLSDYLRWELLPGGELPL